ncbi:MAG: histidinol-phosphate aminotransferase family protein [Caldilineaceae bacterium]|nr:histidinol-phosphate aminotransferase family protein [Caldilineaceae bacterium]
MPSTSIHGTPDYAELLALGLRPEEVIYFSSNINPYGPPPSVVEAVRDYISRDTLARYPDSLSLSLRRKLAQHHDLPPEAVLVGNGTADLIWLICHRFAASRQVAVLAPTFSEYADGVVMAGGHPTEIVLPGWQRIGTGHYGPGPVSFQQTCDALAAAAPWLVFICNPNNPTGEYLTPNQILELRQAAPHAIWVVDEAYSAFAANGWSADRWVLDGGWIVLHSMTKDFSLGALRLGYLLSSPYLVEQLQAVQPPWNVNGLAQFAGEAALDELTWRDEIMAKMRRDLADFCEEIDSYGYAPRPTTVNYVLAPVGDAKSMRDRLLKQHLIVRDCTSFGLPEYIRIAIQRPDQNQLLLDAMRVIAEEDRLARRQARAERFAHMFAPNRR